MNSEEGMVVLCELCNQQELVFQHAKMIMKAAERTFSEKRDLKDMKERFEALKVQSE